MSRKKSQPKKEIIPEKFIESESEKLEKNYVDLETFSKFTDIFSAYLTELSNKLLIHLVIKFLLPLK